METATKPEAPPQPAAKTAKAEPQDSNLMNNFRETAPAMMAELTRLFRTQTEFKSRAKIRLQMKSILDMLSVDTTYPKAKKEDASEANGAGPRPEAEGRSYENEYIPEPSRMNDNILGESANDPY